MNIVALAGGVGGAKLAEGLAQCLPPSPSPAPRSVTSLNSATGEGRWPPPPAPPPSSTGEGRLTVIVNTGDDFDWMGLRICPDLDTVMYFLVREGYADPKRIAITGASYGGYLTMTALTRHPQVFAAGSAIVPFLNWFTEHANERADLRYWDEQNFGDPVKDAQRFREYSPIFFMENIVAPVQMIAGANDPRCPASETEQAAALLKDMGVPYDVVIYPDEGHGFRKVSNRVDASRKRAEFLNERLAVKKAAVKTKRKPAANKKSAIRRK